MLSRLRRANAEADQWFREHVVIWWMTLVVVPGGAYAGAQVVLGDGSVSDALVLGAVFGVIFATVTVGIQRWRSR